MRPMPLVPIALAALALTAACAVARRIGRGGATRWLDAGVAWTALLVLPPYALGWAGLFSAPTVGGASFAISTSSLLLATRARPTALSEALRDLGRAVLSPVALMRAAFERRAWLALVALAIASFVWLWTALLAWLVPSSGWDGIWYHDTIVGFTIQNRGFAEVPLPQEHEVVNGYPRLVETIAAFFVVLSDDRFLDIAPTLAWPCVAVAFAALAESITGWWNGRVAMACALVLVPGLALQLRSSYVDVAPTFFTLAAIAYVTKPRLRAADLWLAGLACGMLLASKGTGLVQVPVIGLVALARGLRPSRPRLLAGLAGAALLIVAIGAPTYVRNWALHANPMWPITHEVESLGLRFEGPVATTIRAPGLMEWLKGAYGEPRWEEYHHDVRHDGYGHAFPLLLPVIAIASLVQWLWGETRPKRGAGPWIFLIGAGIALVTPPIWWARFGGAVLGCAAALALSWLAHRPRIGALAIAFVLAVHGYTLARARPGWHASLNDARTLLRRPAAERASFPVGPVFGDEDALRAFERGVGPDDVVAWSRPMGFPSFAWNRHMSNRSVYLRSLDRRSLDEAGATWVIVLERSGSARALERDPDFERVGMITDVLVSYRRRPPHREPLLPLRSGDGMPSRDDAGEKP